MGPFRAVTRLFSRETAILVCILLIAAFFRFYRIDQFPPGLQFDESYYLFDTLRVVQGQFSLFFTANNGREPLYMYLASAAVAFFGAQELSMRLVSALIGTATVGLTFGFVRALFRSTTVAAFTSFFAAISIWHIYNSRSGQRVILVVLLTVLTLWWFWLGMDAIDSGKSRKRAWRDFAFAGLSAALTAYTYTSGRLLPFILIAITILAILLNRAHAGTLIVGLVITGVTTIIVFLPLGLYFLTHPQDFSSHTANLSILDPAVNKGDLVTAFRQNLVGVAGMFLVEGDHLGFRNVFNRPVFDPVSGVFFILGLILLVAALFARSSTSRVRLRSLLIALCLCVFLAVSVLSDDPPNFGRTLVAVPYAMILPGWGAAFVWERFRQSHARVWVAGIIGLCLAASAISSFYDYFVRFAGSPATYYALDVDRFDAAIWVNQNGNQNTIFLAPLWFQHGTVTFLTRNTPLKSFESRDTVILPGSSSGKDALYAFPLEQAQKGANFAARLGTLALTEAVTGTNGAKILDVYRVPNKYLPDLASPLDVLARGGAFLRPQTIQQANWSNLMELLGYTLSPEGPGGRNFTMTLFLNALNPMTEDYTFSIKARDNKGRVWGQEDKWPGDNSYATSQWSPGDVIVEKFYPGLSACAPAGTYTVTVEAYKPATMNVLSVEGSESKAVPLGTLQAGASESNRLEDLDPDQIEETRVDDQLQLMGYTLSAGELHAGEEFALALFWRGKPNPGTGKITVRLQDGASKDFVLGEWTINVPPEGRGSCSFLDLSVPADISTGAATIWVNNSKIMPVQVMK